MRSTLTIDCVVDVEHYVRGPVHKDTVNGKIAWYTDKPYEITLTLSGYEDTVYLSLDLLREGLLAPGRMHGAGYLRVVLNGRTVTYGRVAPDNTRWLYYLPYVAIHQVIKDITGLSKVNAVTQVWDNVVDDTISRILDAGNPTP